MSKIDATTLESMLKVLLSVGLGGLIGLEREWRGRNAGLRTNMLIAMGACLFTILSISGFPSQGSAQDSARVAAQIVSGIGFLGAGALYRGQHSTKGITTAASIWLVAAIGMAVGTSEYVLASFSAVLAFAILRLLRPISKRVGGQSKRQDKSL